MAKSRASCGQLISDFPREIILRVIKHGENLNRFTFALCEANAVAHQRTAGGAAGSKTRKTKSAAKFVLEVKVLWRPYLL